MSEEKRIIVNFNNPEGKMHLKMKGKKCVDQALNVMKAFDKACNEIGDVKKEGD